MTTSPPTEAPEFRPPREKFLSIRGTVTGRQSFVLGLAGLMLFLLIWQVGHWATPELERKFLPGVDEIVGKIFFLIKEKGFLADIGVSLYRIYVSFFVACIVAVPLGLLMGCFVKVQALVNPTVGGLRYLPAASFVPLLLVYLGPTDVAKMALLFLGCVFFLIALILDNVLSVPKEFIESAQTMGANRRHIVIQVALRSAAPQILDSMRNMIAV